MCFLTPPVAAAILRATLVTNCFLGALSPVDLRLFYFINVNLDRIVIVLIRFKLSKHFETRISDVAYK
jgi:hypothetical protein